ncbi:MAG: putative 2,3-diketo-L-gulonate-binding periplasmic protein YiaO [Peptococcaceae bacterium]|jgi:tripartite ATP-independent transporter DctP family solute receptor|nr:putative 2,3-diketo-L-gulonate-binding periplasmic protein YiaO [Peptococcaceae bacterium]
MKKSRGTYFLILVLISMLLVGMTGCSGKPAGNETKPPENTKITLKLGHPYDEKQPLHQASVKFAEIVSQKTKGNVEIKIFPNNTLGSSRDLAEGVQLGTVDMALIPTTNVAAFYKPIDIFYFPFIFRDKEHAYKVCDGPVGQKLFEGLRKEKGMRTLAVYESGFRQITNSKKPIRTPEDFSGIKMRVTDSPINLATFKALGANATPMALSEVFTALQQGTVDGQDNPIGNVYSFRYYEVQKYLTLTGHQWAGIMVLVSEKVWSKIPADYQKIIQDAAKESEAWQRVEINKKEGEFLDTMKKAGLQVIELTPEEKAKFQEKMKAVWTEYQEKVGKELVDSVVNTK